MDIHESNAGFCFETITEYDPSGNVSSSVTIRVEDGKRPPYFEDMFVPIPLERPSLPGCSPNGFEGY